MKIYQYNGQANICGGNIRKYRHQLKLTQDELAARLQTRYNVQLEQKSISRIEIGERFVADYELLAISGALGISVEHLLEENELKK